MEEHHHRNPHLPTAAEARQSRRRPERWAVFRAEHSAWLAPLWYLDWLAEWAAWGLSRLALLELLEYVGSCSLLIGLIVYVWEAPERVKIRHYQAWQVINTAQGKGGSGGRIEAMQELNEDHVPLVGVDAAGAFLQGVRLEKGDLHRGDFYAADMREAVLKGGNLEDCVFNATNLEGADLSGSDLQDAILSGADLSGASLAGADLRGVYLYAADLRGCDLSGVSNLDAVKTFHLANIHGVKNAPAGFVELAKSRGAVDIADDGNWEMLIRADRSSPQ